MIKMIIATGRNGEIGADNKLLWNIPADLKLFKEKTEGGVVIMGSNTYKSLPIYPRGLPNRMNYVLTSKTKGLVSDNVCCVPEYILRLGIRAKKDREDLWIIGGASVYAQFKDLVDEVHWTYVDREYPEADTFMDMSFVNSTTFRRKSLTKLEDDVDVFVFEKIKEEEAV